jgi:hypothetical protein
MPDRRESRFPEESLDIVEWVMAMEMNDGDLDDENFAALVRKLGPRGPRGKAGAAAKPEEPIGG